MKNGKSSSPNGMSAAAVGDVSPPSSECVISTCASRWKMTMTTTVPPASPEPPTWQCDRARKNLLELRNQERREREKESERESVRVRGGEGEARTHIHTYSVRYNRSASARSTIDIRSSSRNKQRQRGKRRGPDQEEKVEVKETIAVLMKTGRKKEINKKEERIRKEELV